MKYKDFEDFLQTIHAENYADGVLDDDLGDHYEDWITNDLMQEELMEYADKYAKIRFIEGQLAGLAQGKEITMNALDDMTHNAGHDDEWTEKVVHEEGDFSGVTEDR